MLNTKTILLSILSLFILSGCSTTKTMVIKEQVYVPVPEAFYTKVDMPLPIDIDKYLNKNNDERETMLVESLAEHQFTIIELLKTRDKLKEWNDKQLIIYNKNKKE